MLICWVVQLERYRSLPSWPNTTKINKKLVQYISCPSLCVSFSELFAIRTRNIFRLSSACAWQKIRFARFVKVIFLTPGPLLATARLFPTHFLYLCSFSVEKLAIRLPVRLSDQHNKKKKQNHRDMSWETEKERFPDNLHAIATTGFGHWLAQPSTNVCKILFSVFGAETFERLMGS